MTDLNHLEFSVISIAFHYGVGIKYVKAPQQRQVIQLKKMLSLGPRIELLLLLCRS